MAGASDDLEARWPRWPDGEEGRVALDVVLDLPVDQAFLLLYGGLTDLRKAFNEVAGDKEYSTTGWVESAEAVQAAAVAPTPPPLTSVAGLKPGLLRRASYSGTMMGSKYRNEELYRLVEAAPGSSYTLMTTVLTTAMHGEKFRPVVVSTLRALSDGRTELRIRTTIMFILKPNGFIKAMIDKGARDGQRKNFESLRKVLSQFTTVSEPAAAGEVVPAAAAPAAEAASAAAVAPAGEPAPAAGLLETVFGATACRRLQPWAALLHGRLAAAVPALGELVEPSVLLALLGAICLLSALRLVIDMLSFVRHASADPRDTIGLLTHVVFRLVDTPESLQEVLVSCLILYTVRLLVNRLADALPAPPRALDVAAPSEPAAASPPAAAAAPPAALGPLAAGVAAVVAAGAPAGAAGQGAKPTRSEEQEAEGVKYEGYAEAIAAAQAQPTSPVSSAGLSTADSGAAAAAAETAAARQPGAASSFSMKGFTKSISDAFTPARRSKTSGPALAGAGAGEAAPAGAAPSPPNGPAGRAEDRPAAAVAAPAASSAPGSPPAITGLSGAVAGASPLAAGAAAVVATASAGAVGSPPSPPPPGARCLSESDALLAGAAASLSAESSSSGLGAGGATTAASEPGSLQDSSRSSIAQKLRGVLSPGAQPSSPRERPSSGDASAAASPERGGAFSPTAAQRDFRPAMPAHLAPELAGQAVIEEIFENQRLQPFRGWGHTWPGHFLPTDKVNHWSRREHEGFPVLASADFNAIAPPLPEGWQWCEEKWHIDRSPQIIDACDADGWSYGLDFGYVKHPFQPNSGKKKMSDFVRRRRWIRTRVPLALASQPRATAIAKDSTSWEAEAVAAEPGAAMAAGEPAAAEVQTGAAAPALPAVEGQDTFESAAAEATLAAPDELRNEAPTAATAQDEAAAEPLEAAAGPPAGQAATPEAVPGEEPSLDDVQGRAAAVLANMFAQVEPHSAQASMQEALAQTIGSRSGSDTAHLPLPPAQQEQPAVAAEASAALGVAPSQAPEPGVVGADEAARAEAADASPPSSAGQPGSARGQHEPAPPAEEPSTDSHAAPAAAAAAEPGSGPASPAPAAAAPSEDEGGSPAVLAGELQRTHTGGPKGDEEEGDAAGGPAVHAAAEGPQAAVQPEPAVQEAGKLPALAAAPELPAHESRSAAAASEPVEANLAGTSEPPAASELGAGTPPPAGQANVSPAAGAPNNDGAVTPSASDSVHLVAHR